jgi:hypothetical protein
MAIPSTSVRTVDFLPEIFQTPVNAQFLAATLDQLVQEPKFKETQGFVGRRIGPGVTLPTDHYVIEPTADRNHYQLEPGVVQLNPNNTNKIVDAITYPGMLDALSTQGANVANADRLFASDYYAFDPFVDYDKFSNFSQYYWLPSGPLAVDVSATAIPLTDDFTVTRANGVYTFSGYAGNNPALTLARGGSYNFNVAQNNTATVEYRVSNSGTSAWIVDYQRNPTLTLTRGNTYNFNFSLTPALNFYIKTEASFGTTNLYNTGVVNNGASIGTLTFTVPQDAPDTLYYCNDLEYNLRGQFNIIDGTPGTGSGFWIQTDPGVNGRIPATPNISSRNVLGVTNNGEDLGTVTFDVPLSTAQNFYYGLNDIGPVSLATTLNFNQINNVPVANVVAAGGIDGITNLENRTLVFVNQGAGNWTINTLPSGDSNPENYPDPIAPTALQNSIWQIRYVDVGGVPYIQLVSFLAMSDTDKFTVTFGTQWASTQWYKNGSGIIEEIPLLTAIKDLLFYQDGTDPNIFGPIHLVDQNLTAAIDIDQIIGAKNYTSPNGVVFTNGLKVIFRGTTVPASYENVEYYVEGVGTAIKLLPVSNYVTPETYTQSASVPYDTTAYDTGNFDATLNAPLIKDYITINRASPDLNAWARSNRWFHIDVINASAAYNNTTPTFDNAQRAKRPILEFRAGLRLFDYGTQGLAPVNIIDFVQKNALLNVAGSTGYSIDGYSLVDGSTIIFAADSDPTVRNQVYRVQFITPDTVPPLIPEPVINLIPLATNPVLIDQTTICLSGIKSQGLSFYYNGVTWAETQQKTNVNQPPLFDVYDQNGISLGDRLVYPSSTFTGNQLFGYYPGTGTPDTELGFALTYLSLNNIGDIIFSNFLYTDTFNYTVDTVGQTENVSIGFAREYSNRVNYVKEIGWQTGITKSRQRQQFQFTYNGLPIQLDIPVEINNLVPPVQLFVNSEYQEPNSYALTVTDATTTIRFLNTVALGSVVTVDALSNSVSATAFYQVPTNLSNNPFNNNSSQFTLGTIRNHYNTICQNLIDIQGPINGANNSRDLGNLVPYGEQILQQSSPLTLAGFFLRDPNYNIFASLTYNSKEYIKFKSQLLNAVVNMDINPDATTAEILDKAIATITTGRTSLNSFYWSDMLPTGSSYTSISTTVSPITTKTFNTTQVYTFTSANFLALLVYVNNVLLVKGRDYVVSPDSPKLTITISLAVGDIVTINEYKNTAGNYVPNTPTKLGLYPKYVPQIYYDPNYLDPTVVIQGHDGSITVAFGDIRDQVLLEFETRIYDNLKTEGNPVPLTIADVQPGYFRQTDYSTQQINNILTEEFLSWVGGNKLTYQTQEYIATNPFTYNYSQSGAKITPQGQVSNTYESPLPGAWRGAYKYFYDTTSPNLTPWEMLGFSEEPAWWQQRYGPRPYTSDNLVLWDDLQNGYVADPTAPYVDPRYVRPGLTNIIPVDGQGQLLAPIESLVGLYDPTTFQKSWAPGDGAPVENTWWTSSSYPFSVMRLLALTRPAEFFSLFADRDLYRYDLTLDQYLLNKRYRLDGNGVQIYGNGVSKASYIDWIVDYNQQLGVNSTTALTNDLANLDVRLCYRMASFCSPQYLQMYTETSSPNSNNTSLQIPVESYTLIPSYVNQPFDSISYSALIIEQVEGGYAVYGYNNTNAYFSILTSIASGATQTVSAGGSVVQVPAQYTDVVTQIPYGYVFTNDTIMVDFILSYGAYLESQGMTFDSVENGYTLNWKQMAQEFLYWSNQGWGTGTMINLNPVASTLTVSRPYSVVAGIESLTPDNMLLDQNRGSLPTRNLIVERNGNTFSITATTSQTISFLKLQFTSYESMVVLNNLTVFNDLLYDPTTAARVTRIRVAASTSVDWNGELNAQGFILNNPATVQQWQPYIRYTKGEIVIYKNTYWSAAEIVQPADSFNFNQWIKSQYALIDVGFLQNIANKADQLADSYNINYQNIVQDQNLLAYGLTGYRPRQYMAKLDLNSVSQVNLYLQFLGNKGTNRAAELFTYADLGKETGQYAIFENWAILAGTYGATANKRFFELELNEAFLQADPSTVQVIQPGQDSQANQAIYVSNIWAESYPITTPEILTTIYTPSVQTALPTAGYVNLADADIKVFSLDNPSSIEANISTVGTGTIIWVAVDNPYTWNIYRCALTPAKMFQLQDNLNGTSTAQFTNTHNLKVGDLIIIRYFNAGVDGVYRVLSIPTITSITIAFSFVNTNQLSISGTGLVFFLQSCRVKQASDIAKLPYANDLLPGAKAWVDNNGQGHWEVLEKQQPFTSGQTLSPTSIFGTPSVTVTEFGYSVSQTSNNFITLVGTPGTGSDAGTVFTYRRITIGDVTSLAQNTGLQLTATATVGYGNDVDFGNNTWGAAGASASNSGAGYVTPLYLVPGSATIAQTQLLVAPDQDFASINFGASISVSHDEHWMYVGAPGGNKVYAYGRVDIPEQSVIYTANGTTTGFNYSDTIEINSTNTDQLIVVVNNLEAIYGTDYVLNGTDVVFTVAPGTGQKVLLARRQSTQLDQTIYYQVAQNSTSGVGTGARFTVANTRGSYNVTLTESGQGYQPGDQLTVSYLQIDPAGSSANNLIINVTHTNAGGITGFTYSGSGINNTATFDLTTSLYTVSSIYSFTITVNTALQRPYIDYTYSAGVVTFVTLPPAGATITATSGTYWEYINTITVSGLSAGADFGASITTTTDGRQVFIGAPANDVGSINQAGSVYAVDRSVVDYIISDSTQLAYTIPGTATAPIAVLLNNQYLTNSAQYLNGQYTISGSTVYISSSVTLTPGDILTVETNQFSLLQTLTAQTPSTQSAYGRSAKIGLDDGNLYVGAPLTAVDKLAQAGIVESKVNQSRVYGITTSTIANPTLTAGDTIRVNDILITVPDAPNNTVAGLISAINSAGVPNAIATPTTDLKFVGNGSTQIFNIGSLYAAANSYTTVVYVDSVLQTAGINYTYNSTSQEIIFVTAPVAGSQIVVVSGRVTVSIINSKAVDPFNKLSVLPGLNGSAFDNLGFETFVWAQTITSPAPATSAYFGYALDVDSDPKIGSASLIIGAPNGNVYEPTIFDAGKTYFDDHSTTFFSPIVNSGVAYTFDFLPSINASVTNPGAFAFGQQIYSHQLKSGYAFGRSVHYVNAKLLIGAPADPTNNNIAFDGEVFVYNNDSDIPTWAVTYYQQPVADVELINTVYSYDKLASTVTQYYDFINPLQGKILGVARSNIDYIGSVDPAFYNQGTVHNVGNSWGRAQLGQIWWDTATVRFIDPNQDNILYTASQWSQLFPGSTVDIYQWTESSVPPAQYTGPGTVLSTTTYNTGSNLDINNVLSTHYYFWVKGITTIATTAGKTLPPTGIAGYISDPANSGLPFIAPINASSIAIFNAKNLISAQDTILHIGYDAKYNNDDIHTEYQFIADGKPDAFLNDTLYRKLQDSFCGVDIFGNAVPDPTLPPAMRYGVQFRPRQSMFADRFVALKNYLTYVNSILIQYPISETRSFELLNSSQAYPQKSIATASQCSISGTVLTVTPSTVVGVFKLGMTITGNNIPANTVITKLLSSSTYEINRSLTIGSVAITGTAGYNSVVANLTELSYQDLNIVPLGYLYLVESDSGQNGRWSVYSVYPGDLPGQRVLNLMRVQSYDTPLYWSYVTWYLPGYNSAVLPMLQVQYYANLAELSLERVPLGGSVEVLQNANGNFEIYQRTGLDPVTGWTRVGLENGTIQFNEVLWNYALGNFGFDAGVFDSQYFDQEPVTETRYIIQAINQQLLINELAINRNHALILMFNFIYSEFTAPEWLFKSSYIDVAHYIRALLPYQFYTQDNQNFVLDYLQEVKPYHVQTREFNLVYSGDDSYPGEITDFDLPAYYDYTLEPPQFISPILLPYDHATTPARSTASDKESNAQVWLEEPWINWFGNYLLEILNVNIVDPGAGYTVAPDVVVTGTCVTLAVMTAVINSAGQVVGINIVDPGYGYSTTATITLVGGTGSGATAVAQMYNPVVRSFDTTIKYDRYEYRSTILEWQPNVTYPAGTQVRYSNAVWSANSTVDSTVFDTAQWTLVPADTLSGVDRTMGYYNPEFNPNIPGLSLPLLIDGVSYPGVQVYGLGYDFSTGFDVTPYDTTPFDNITISPEGWPTYDLNVLDAMYESSYLDTYLGTRPTDINVDGGEYIDVFSSYAPEELVPGSEFDTLDMRVYTTPGADWQGLGHGFPQYSKSYVYDSAEPTIVFSVGINSLPYPVTLSVTNQSTGVALNLGINYTVDWVANTVTFINSSGGANTGDVVTITTYELGGGNQVYKNIYSGTVTDSITVPVAYYQAGGTVPAIQEFVIFVNGQYLDNTNYSYAPGLAYSTTTVTFNTAFTGADFISLTVLEPTTINNVTTNYSWSAPQTQLIAGTGSFNYPLTNSLEYTNPINLIVTVNGRRARTAAGIEYIGDGSTVVYDVAQRLGFAQSTILSSEVNVYVDNIPLTLDVDFAVLPYVSGPLQIQFTTAPTVGQQILISVTTGTQCYVDNSTLVFDPTGGLIPTVGSTIAVTTWNDTREQNIVTQVIVGPTTVGITVQDPFDPLPPNPTIPNPATPGSFDYATVNNTEWSFDYSAGVTMSLNNIQLTYAVTDPTRLIVTLNGRQLFLNNGFTLNGTEVVLSSGLLRPTDVLMVTEFTNSVVPESMAFRIFQDMRGVQATYRITPQTTTTLTQALTQLGDVVHVADATALSEPNLLANVWGVITINGERIMYRYRDTVANTVSGLLRGTAGTGAAAHEVDALVYDMSRGNLLPVEYQNYIVSNSVIADGTQVTFTAPDITLGYADAEPFAQLPYDVGTVTGDPGTYDYGLGTPELELEVYVAGILIPTTDYTVDQLNPATVTFVTPPPSGAEVTLLVRRGSVWYQQGATTASDGVPLQETNTPAARFLRGLA